MANSDATTDKKKSDLIPRLTTAAIAIPILLGIIFFTPSVGFFALVVAAGCISAWEYVRITCDKTLPMLSYVATFLTLVALCFQYFLPSHLLTGLMGVIIALFLFMLFGYRDQKQATHHLAHGLMAIVYGGLMLGCFALMRRHTGVNGPLFVLMTLGIIWGSDTGAYFAGRAFGKHKLYPAVSPNKSIEGAIGGVISSVLLVFGFNLLFGLLSESWLSLSVFQIFLLAIPGNILGQLGDLCESLIKRAHGVKDSGTIIRGHGGMLDRIDALILASPWFYIFVTHFYEMPSS